MNEKSMKTGAELIVEYLIRCVLNAVGVFAWVTWDRTAPTQTRPTCSCISRPYSHLCCVRGRRRWSYKQPSVLLILDVCADSDNIGQRQYLTFSEGIFSRTYLLHVQAGPQYVLHALIVHLVLWSCTHVTLHIRAWSLIKEVHFTRWTL